MNINVTFESMEEMKAFCRAITGDMAEKPQPVSKNTASVPANHRAKSGAVSAGSGTASYNTAVCSSASSSSGTGKSCSSSDNHTDI